MISARFSRKLSTLGPTVIGMCRFGMASFAKRQANEGMESKAYKEKKSQSFCSQFCLDLHSYSRLLSLFGKRSLGSTLNLGILGNAIIQLWSLSQSQEFSNPKYQLSIRTQEFLLQYLWLFDFYIYWPLVN